MMISGMLLLDPFLSSARRGPSKGVLTASLSSSSPSDPSDPSGVPSKSSGSGEASKVEGVAAGTVADVRGVGKGEGGADERRWRASMPLRLLLNQ